jgi:hypothetical protein
MTHATRIAERPAHDEAQKYWCPKFGEWLSLDELHYYNSQAQQQNKTVCSDCLGECESILQNMREALRVPISTHREIQKAIEQGLDIGECFL